MTGLGLPGVCDRLRRLSISKVPVGSGDARCSQDVCRIRAVSVIGPCAVVSADWLTISTSTPDGTGRGLVDERHATDEPLVRKLGRVMVERAAPAEIVMFGPVSRAFLENPDNASATRKRSAAGPLGFGDSGETVELLTPALLHAATEASAYLAGQGIAGTTGHDVIAALSDEQRARVHDIVERALRGQGLSADRVASLAGAVAGADRKPEGRR